MYVKKCKLIKKIVKMRKNFLHILEKNGILNASETY